MATAEKVAEPKDKVDDSSGGDGPGSGEGVSAARQASLLRGVTAAVHRGVTCGLPAQSRLLFSALFASRLAAAESEARLQAADRRAADAALADRDAAAAAAASERERVASAAAEWRFLLVGELPSTAAAAASAEGKRRAEPNPSKCDDENRI